MPLTPPNAMAVGIALGGTIVLLTLGPALRSTPQEALPDPPSLPAIPCAASRVCGGG